MIMTHSAQFHQVLTFSHSVNLKAIRVLMKDPQSQYFGISLVQLLGGGFPTLRIQSGITSPHQASPLCLKQPLSIISDILLRTCVFKVTRGVMWFLTVASCRLQELKSELCGSSMNKVSVLGVF